MDTLYLSCFQIIGDTFVSSITPKSVVYNFCTHLVKHLYIILILYSYVHFYLSLLTTTVMYVISKYLETYVCTI